MGSAMNGALHVALHEPEFNAAFPLKEGNRARLIDTAEAPGGTYAHLFYVADAEGIGPVMNGELHVALDEAELNAAFPMKGGNRARLIGMAEAPGGGGQEALAWEDVGKGVLGRLGVTVERVN